jgi:hypothetical protein
MFVKASQKWVTITKALAYITEFITALRSFIAQAPGRPWLSEGNLICLTGQLMAKISP